MTKQEFYNNAISFLELLFEDLEKSSIFLDPNWDVDHICYRVDSLDLYEKNKVDLLGFSDLLIESEVNGRSIATYKLHQPIEFKEWAIQLVELPAPKKSKPTVTGFEHVEVVCDVSFEVLKTRYGHLKLDLGGLEKDFNQEFEISLGARNIKFHHLSLQSVINLEKNKPVFEALKKSNVLKAMKKYAPLVVGTFPLALNQAASDLDILLCAADLQDLKDAVIEHCRDFQDFKLQISFLNGVETLTAEFIVDQIPFEIFAQSQQAILQNAAIHFLIEERLLKIGGKNLAEKVMELRHQGLKTEPAFAKALSLSGDSYAALLELQKKSNQDIKQLFFTKS